MRGDVVSDRLPERTGRTLELGCSVGVFTAMLAPRASHLVAVDFSPTALERARRRVESFDHVEVRQATIRDIVSATGQVEPREIVVVTSETPGRVLRLLGHVGKSVVDGEELAQLDDRGLFLSRWQRLRTHPSREEWGLQDDRQTWALQ